MDKAQLDKLMKRFPVTKLATGNIRTCPVRLSYPNLFEKSKSNGGKYQEKYGATLLFPKGADISLLKTVAQQCAVEEFGPKAKGLRMPFRNQGEKADKAGYVDGATFFRANSDFRPGVRDSKGAEILDSSEIYPGCWVLVTLNAYPYDNQGKGVTFGLQNVIKIADDDSFGGSNANPDDEFADVLDGTADPDDLLGETDSALEDVL